MYGGRQLLMAGPRNVQSVVVGSKDGLSVVAVGAAGAGAGAAELVDGGTTGDVGVAAGGNALVVVAGVVGVTATGVLAVGVGVGAGPPAAGGTGIVCAVSVGGGAGVDPSLNCHEH